MTYPDDYINRIICGDCLEVLKTMPDNSIDSIVTDPPYGLEFMGKDWDKFAVGRGAKYKSAGSIENVSLPGTGFTKLPGYTKRPAKKCKKCGKQAWSGSPCRCENPEWELDNSVLLSFQEFAFKWATEALRILKPGGHLLSACGTRTYHRMACAIEDAGFEIRDTVGYLYSRNQALQDLYTTLNAEQRKMLEKALGNDNVCCWSYGSGFPKSLNIGKAVDKIQGNERTPYERPDFVARSNKTEQRKSQVICGEKGKYTIGTSPYEGFGTALKPAMELWCLARRPLSENTVALNVLKWGTGGINIDGCRVGMSQEDIEIVNAKASKENNGVNFDVAKSKNKGTATKANNQGRWPANIIHDGSEEVVRGFPANRPGMSGGGVHRADYKGGMFGAIDSDGTARGDSGSASRFFYCAKASKAERNKGLEGFDIKKGGGMQCRHDGSLDGKITYTQNHHPTVKPIALMRYLCRLITPPNGIVLDPFAGSGSTCIAAKLEGFNYIGIEKEEEYVAIARARVAAWHREGGLFND